MRRHQYGYPMISYLESCLTRIVSFKVPFLLIFNHLDSYSLPNQPPTFILEERIF
uniref:Uncharacterized protein n=1 Tax=Tetranychus urticae TaxID=32264 RepID=T1KLJ5_TETUR